MAKMRDRSPIGIVPGVPVKLDVTDLGIIHRLHRDPRSSIARVAKDLGVPNSTVRHRLNRLVRRQAIEFSVVSNPLQFGFQIWAIIEIKTALPRIREVARRLAEASEVYFVAIMAGGYDINVAAVFRSNAELLDFVTHRLSKIPGIVSTSTATVLELCKRTSFTVPRDAVAAILGKAKTGNGSARRRR